MCDSDDVWEYLSNECIFDAEFLGVMFFAYVVEDPWELWNAQDVWDWIYTYCGGKEL